MLKLHNPFDSELDILTIIFDVLLDPLDIFYRVHNGISQPLFSSRLLKQQPSSLVARLGTILYLSGKLINHENFEFFVVISGRNPGFYFG